MLRSFNSIYQFIIQATIAGFGLIFTGLCFFGVYVLCDNILWYIPVFIFALIVSIIAGSYINVVLSIPFQLPKKFDPLKNNVSLNKYANLQEFQEDIADFMIGFFNFLGFDIVAGKFHFKNCEATIKACDVDFSHVKQDSFKNNKLKLVKGYHAFHIPIDLGGEYLGYMIVITKGYTLPVFHSVLQDFENYYLDDQIKHFLN